MQINFESGELTEHDALALAILIHSMHPQVMGTISLMTTTAHRAMSGPDGDAVRVFTGGPAAVAPAAERAFTDPQFTGTGGALGAEDEPDLSGSAGDASGASAGMTSSTTGAAEFDSSGLPWDARIHSGGRAVIGDGTWKKKKGVGADTVTAVTAELRAALGGAPPLPPAAAAPPPPTPAAAPPVAPPPPAPAAPPAGSGATPFVTVMMRITNEQKAGRLLPAELEVVCAMVGIDTPRAILTQGDLAPAFLAAMDEFLAAKA